MLLGQSLNAAIERLAAAQVPSPRLNAELLLMFTLGRDRAFFYGHPEYELTASEQAQYQDALHQRAQGIPAQYITGHQEFWGMDLIVSPAVLIPRPETEHVVEAALARVGWTVLPDQVSEGRRPLPAKIRAIDVGTGSGCIALALAKELPQAEIHATEISAPALEIARANAARHQFETRIRFFETDLLAGIGKGEFDLVVSNPPYVGEAEQDQVQLEVRKFEPRGAVFAGESGTEVIQRLIPQAHEVLRAGGWLIMEISGSIARRVHELLSGWEDVQIANDLQGIPRVASARKA